MSAPLHEPVPKTVARSNRAWVLLALSVAAAVLPYLTTLTFGFVYDDHLAIEENPHLRVWPGLGRIFFSDIWSLSGLSKQSNYYRPMFVLAYAAVVRIAGAAPWAFHALNIAFHAAATGLVFFLTLRFWHKESTAAVAAILFALHPVHVEAVAWIATLSELAYTFFVLAAVYLYTEARVSRLAPVGALFCFAVALLWKESAVAFAPIAVLYDVLVLKRWRWSRWVLIVAVLLTYVGLRALAMGGFAPSVQYPGLSPLVQGLTAIANVGFYVRKLLLPIHLSAFYLPEFVGKINVNVLTALLLAFLAAWKLRDKSAWAVCWILAALFPVLLVSRIAVPLADRDLYLPSVGFVWLIVMSLERFGRRIVIPAAAALAVIYAALSLARLPQWHDDFALLEHELRQDPENQAVRLLLASEFGRRGRFAEAIAELDQLLASDPQNLEALQSKAGLLASMKNWPELLATCARVFSIDSKSARCLLDTAFFDEEQGKLIEAREKFARAYRADTGLSQALLHQGIIEARMGDLSAAAGTLELAVERNPTAAALTNLGSVYANRGDMKKAVEAFQKAVDVDPTFQQARSNLENALADSKLPTRNP